MGIQTKNDVMGGAHNKSEGYARSVLVVNPKEKCPLFRWDPPKTSSAVPVVAFKIKSGLHTNSIKKTLTCSCRPVSYIRPVSTHVNVAPLIPPNHWKECSKPLHCISFFFLFPCRWTCVYMCNHYSEKLNHGKYHVTIGQRNCSSQLQLYRSSKRNVKDLTTMIYALYGGQFMTSTNRKTSTNKYSFKEKVTSIDWL
jgi:hypothetical protein